MNNKLEIFKKRLIYRAGYRGTKEMDILLSTFVNKNINSLNENQLYELEIFLNYEDDIISSSKFRNFSSSFKSVTSKVSIYLLTKELNKISISFVPR